jgi:hypothetical protein
MLAGWFGPAVLVVIISGLDRDCGNALGAFFNRAVWLSRRVPRPRTAVEQDMSRTRNCTALIIADLTKGTGRFNLAQGFVGTLSGIGASLSTTFFSLVSGNFGGAIGFISIACVALSLVVIVWFWMPETMPSSTKPRARL